MKKYAIIGVLAFVFFAMPVASKAQTVTELQAQLQQLVTKISIFNQRYLGAAYGSNLTQTNTASTPAAKTPLVQTFFNGGVKILPTEARPACTSEMRGTFWFTQGGPGTKDEASVCAKDMASQYAWRTLY